MPSATLLSVVRFVLPVLLLAGAVLYTRRHLANFPRTSLGGRRTFEDSPSGTGLRYDFTKVAADTNGESVVLTILVRGRAPGFYKELAGSLPKHSHKVETEQLTVREGVLHAMVGGKFSERKAGESIIIPAGVPHLFWNGANHTDLLLEAVVTPAGKMEHFLRNLAGLGKDYGGLDKIHPLQIIVTFHDSDTVMEDLLPFLRPISSKLFNPVAKFLGFQGFYAEYALSEGSAPGVKSSHGKDEL